MKMNLFLYPLLFALLLVCAEGSFAQNAYPIQLLDLGDSMKVGVYELRENGKRSHEYYYLPLGLRAALGADKAPQFSFTGYREEDNQPLSGAIMHLLLQWGPGEAGESRLQQALQAQLDSLGVIMGAALVESVPGREGFAISSRKKPELAQILNRSLKSYGGVPNTPGAKWAASFRLSGPDAQAMEQHLTQDAALKDIVITFFFHLPGSSEQIPLSASLYQILKK